MLEIGEVEKILETTKLRFLIHEKSKLVGVNTLDALVLHRDGRFLVLLLLEEKPRRKEIIDIACSELGIWFTWKKGDKVYVQKAGMKMSFPWSLGKSMRS